MPVEPGAMLLHYRLAEKLGEGGMGVVWRATDTTLDRDVAIKILPDAFAAEPERLVRFEREAKVLASLNHPGIASVFSVHEADGIHFLAMELVAGEDLAKRLERGPLRVEEALYVAVQVAEALEAAHENGIVHRDLKPANIQIAPDGRVKVLDFGLAKALEPDPDGKTVDLSYSPTVTSAGTLAGVILGTAAYMSPEQARGKTIDRRTDVWAFGCVLFECLTGGSIFRGESVSDTIGAILHKEPDWAALPSGTPPVVRLLLHRCLARNPANRLHDIADARIELRQAIADPTGAGLGLPGTAAATGRLFSPLGIAAVGLLAIAGGLAAGWFLRGSPRDVPLRKLDLGIAIDTGPTNMIDAVVAVSPDGTQVAFVNQGSLWVQDLDAFDPRLLEGTDGADSPFWSPDGATLGYFARGKLFKVPVNGGRSVAVADIGGSTVGGVGASWGENDRIVFSRGNSGILEVSALGGEPREVVPTGEDEGDLHTPEVLPGGNGFLFVAHPTGKPPGQIWVWDGEERRMLYQGGEGQFFDPPRYSPTGHLVFAVFGGDVTQGLWAIPFSLGSLEVTGEPFLVVPDAASASLARDGTLAFVHRPAASGLEALVWVDRSGSPVGTIGEPQRGIYAPVMSADARRLVASLNVDAEGNSDLWVLDLERGTRTRLTSSEGFEYPVKFNHAGTEVYYVSYEDGAGKTLAVAADGSVAPREILAEGSMSDDDGTRIVFGKSSEDTKGDIWVAPLDGSAEPVPILQTKARELPCGISPDGRFLLYVSDLSGTNQVYLTRFPQGTGRWQVSVAGGRRPVWAHRGDKIHYIWEDKIMEVSVETGGDEPRLGKPVELFEVPKGLPYSPRPFAVSSDGERFVVTERVREDDDEEEPRRPGIKVVQNWIAEFR